MCVASCLTCIFNIILLASTILVGCAFVTPGWQKVIINGTDVTNPADLANEGKYLWSCANDITDCAQGIWDSLKEYEKATLMLFAACVGVCVVTMVWACAVAFACCCKSLVAIPLPILCFIAFLLDAIGIAVYIFKKNGDSDTVNFFKHIEKFDDLLHKYGYSIFLAIIGGLGLLADTFVGCAILCVAKVSPV